MQARRTKRIKQLILANIFLGEMSLRKNLTRIKLLAHGTTYIYK
jgi:hypothetical protein